MLDALEEHDIETSIFSMEYRKPEYPVTLMMPYVGAIRGPVVAALCYYAKHLDIGFSFVGNTKIQDARNELADRLLQSSAEWAFWVDSDVFMPYGDPTTFLTYTQATKGATFAQHNTLTRLLSHRQPLVGGVYAGRFRGAPLTIQPDLQPRNPNDPRISDAIREGKSAGGLQPVKWVAAGLCLVHRKVYERIAEVMPVDPAYGYYPFYTDGTRTDEDVIFCEKATAVGCQPMLDTEVRAGHLGECFFMPEDSRPLRIKGRPPRPPYPDAPPSPE